MSLYGQSIYSISLCILCPTCSVPWSKLSRTNRFCTYIWLKKSGEFATLPQKWSIIALQRRNISGPSQTIVLYMVGELAGECLWMWRLAIVKCESWHLAKEIWNKKCDIRPLKPDTFFELVLLLSDVHWFSGSFKCSFTHPKKVFYFYFYYFFLTKKQNNQQILFKLKVRTNWFILNLN